MTLELTDPIENSDLENQSEDINPSYRESEPNILDDRELSSEQDANEAQADCIGRIMSTSLKTAESSWDDKPLDFRDSQTSENEMQQTTDSDLPLAERLKLRTRERILERESIMLEKDSDFHKGASNIHQATESGALALDIDSEICISPDRAEPINSEFMQMVLNSMTKLTENSSAAADESNMGGPKRLR